VVNPPDFMRQLIRNSILRTPGVGAKLKRWILAAAELEKLKPGEYYSPITSDEAIDSYALFDVCQPRIIRRAELNTAEIDLRAPSAFAVGSRPASCVR
jgi:hypothetical protein